MKFKLKALFQKKSLYFFFLILFCLSVNLGLAPNTSKPINLVFLVLFMLFAANLNRYFYRILVVFLALLSGVYAPVGDIYGAPDFNLFAAMLYTNTGEAVEFIGLLSAKYLFFSLLVFILAALVFNKTYTLPQKYRLPFYFFVLILIFFAPIRASFVNKDQVRSRLNLIPVTFLIPFTEHLLDFVAEYRYIQKLNKTPDDWQPVTNKSDYDTYIVVIGESVRRDFMGLYGFPIQNTPYFSQTNGLIFNQYISASNNTHESLAHMLAIPDSKGKAQLHNNVVTLAKKSGFSTYWLANQGTMGPYDTVAATIGQRADHSFFSTKGGSAGSGKEVGSDKILIPYVLNAINAKEKKKIIFVHLMGSHMSACARTENQYEQFYMSKEVSCYIQSIKNTDQLLQTIVTEANRSKQKWSLLYFSDHGLSFIRKNTEDAAFMHSVEYKQNFEVPFIITSYNSNQRTYIDSPRSGIDFVSLFSEWTNIKEARIKNNCPQLTNTDCSGEIKVINGRAYHTLKDDAIPSAP